MMRTDIVLVAVTMIALFSPSKVESELIFQYSEGGAEGFDVQRARQIGTVSMANIESYTLTFRILPLDVVSSWSSILHIGNQDSEVRQPGLWFYPGRTRLHHRQKTSQGNSGLDPGRSLQVGEWADVAIVWSTSDGGVTSRVYFGNELVAEKSFDASLAVLAEDMPVYVGSPWRQAAAARVADVRMYNSALTVEEIEWTRSLNELYGTPVYVEPRLLEFDGQTNYLKGEYTLSPSFYVRANVRIDDSEQWNHLVEIGSLEYEWNGPLRVEVGVEGEWYVSVGDGQTFRELSVQGNWTYEEWLLLEIEYKDGTLRLWQDGEHLGSMQADIEVDSVSGPLNIGNFARGGRYFRGALRNLQIRQLP